MAIRLPFQLPRINLGPRTRRVLRYVGLTFFALFTFVFALQMTFPYERAKDKLIEAVADKYDITIGEVERGFVPGRVYFNSVSIRNRQTKPEETVTIFNIARLEVDLGLFALIGKTISVDFEASIAAGTLSGTVSVEKFGKGSISAEIEGESLPGSNLPMRAAVGLPMSSGKLDFTATIHLPVEKSKMGRTSINWKKARGAINLACPSSCTIGDGKTKLKPLLKKPRDQAMVGDGIDFGKVNLDSLVAKVTIKAGKLTLDKFDAKSKDGEIKVDYMMTLEPEFGDSMVAGCLRFKGSEELMKREPKTFAALQTTGAERRGDGLFHIRLSDRFKDMKRLNAMCGPDTQINNEENFSGKGGSERPNLTVTPDEAARPAIPSPTPIDIAPTPASPPLDAAPATPPPTPPATPPGEGRERGDGQRDPTPAGSGAGSGDSPSPSPTGAAAPPPEG